MNKQNIQVAHSSVVNETEVSSSRAVAELRLKNKTFRPGEFAMVSYKGEDESTQALVAIGTEGGGFRTLNAGNVISVRKVSDWSEVDVPEDVFPDILQLVDEQTYILKCSIDHPEKGIYAGDWAEVYIADGQVRDFEKLGNGPYIFLELESGYRWFYKKVDGIQKIYREDDIFTESTADSILNAIANLNLSISVVTENNDGIIDLRYDKVDKTIELTFATDPDEYKTKIDWYIDDVPVASKESYKAKWWANEGSHELKGKYLVEGTDFTLDVYSTFKVRYTYPVYFKVSESSLYSKKWISKEDVYEAYDLIITNDHIYFKYPTIWGDLISIKDQNGIEYINSYTKTTATDSETGLSYNTYTLINAITVTGAGFSQAYYTSKNYNVDLGVSSIESPIIPGTGQNSAIQKKGGDTASGELSMAVGNGTTAQNKAEFASGKYNKSTPSNDTNGGTIHSVGIGTETAGKNALEIMGNGDTYIYGVGGYEGEYSASSKTIQSIINDYPVEKGAGDYSMIQKNLDNQAVSKGSVALGINNKAGVKGFYWNYINITNKTIYLSKTNDEILATEPSVDTTFINPYAVGDEFSLKDDAGYPNCGTITAIDHNKVTVSILPITKVTVDQNKKYWFWVINKPNPTDATGDFGIGAIAVGENNICTGDGGFASGKDTTAYDRYAHSEGYMTKAGYASHSEGRETTASGLESHAEGRNTISGGRDSHAEGYNSETGGSYETNTKDSGSLTNSGVYAHAEGNSTIAQGHCSHSEGKHTFAKGGVSHAEGLNTTAGGSISHAEGNNTTASGNLSHAEGQNTTAAGSYSHAEGLGTITSNVGEHAEGKYNVSNTGSSNSAKTIHSTGIGTQTTPKNALEVMQNGDVYVYGVGDYNGTNYNTANTLKQIIDNKVNKETGKGLSTNDYTTDEKEKLASVTVSDIQLKSNLETELSTNTAKYPASSLLKSNVNRLDERIDNISSVGRFLSAWNCVTGLPTTNPTTQTYVYQSGDYYIVSNIDSAGKNYRPSGNTYVQGIKSTSEETSSDLKVGSIYKYDNNVWILMDAFDRKILWGSLAGNISDQTDLKNALNEKADAIETLLALDEKMDKLSSSYVLLCNNGGNAGNSNIGYYNNDNIGGICSGGSSEGPTTLAGKNQIAFGDGVIPGSNKSGSVAFGQFTDTTDSTINPSIFSIGNGTSDSDRKNALSIKENDDVYIRYDNNYKSIQSSMDEIVTHGQELVNHGTTLAEHTTLLNIHGAEFGKKQDKLTAGNNITIDDNNVISASAAIGNSWKNGEAAESLMPNYEENNFISGLSVRSIILNGNSNNINGDTTAVSNCNQDAVVYGLNNELHTASHRALVGGIENFVARSEESIVSGTDNNIDNCPRSLVKGQHLRATNKSDCIISGAYNYNTTDEAGGRLILGVGSSDTDRENALFVNGYAKVYVFGLGNYTGKEITGASDLVTVINNLNTTINSLKTIIKNGGEKESYSWSEVGYPFAAYSGIRYIIDTAGASAGEPFAPIFTDGDNNYYQIIIKVGNDPIEFDHDFLPETLKWSKGEVPSTLEANTTYEFSCNDGLACLVDFS